MNNREEGEGKDSVLSPMVMANLEEVRGIRGTTKLKPIHGCIIHCRHWSEKWTVHISFIEEHPVLRRRCVLVSVELTGITPRRVPLLDAAHILGLILVLLVLILVILTS